MFLYTNSLLQVTLSGTKTRVLVPTGTLVLVQVVNGMAVTPQLLQVSMPTQEVMPSPAKMLVAMSATVLAATAVRVCWHQHHPSLALTREQKVTWPATAPSPRRVLAVASTAYAFTVSLLGSTD